MTGAFCAAPHFHPEAVLGLRYHWALDALFHGSYYFVVTLLLYPLVGRKMGAGLVYGALLGFSVLLEVAQAWVPGRSFSALDLVANAVGITGAAVFQFLKNKLKPAY